MGIPTGIPKPIGIVPVGVGNPYTIPTVGAGMASETQKPMGTGAGILMGAPTILSTLNTLD